MANPILDQPKYFEESEHQFLELTMIWSALLLVYLLFLFFNRLIIKKEIGQEQDYSYRERVYKISYLAKFFIFLIVMKVLTIGSMTVFVYHCINKKMNKVDWEALKDNLQLIEGDQDLIDSQICSEAILLYEVFDSVYLIASFGAILLLGMGYRTVYQYGQFLMKKPAFILAVAFLTSVQFFSYARIIPYELSLVLSYFASFTEIFIILNTLFYCHQLSQNVSTMKRIFRGLQNSLIDQINQEDRLQSVMREINTNLNIYMMFLSIYAIFNLLYLLISLSIGYEDVNNAVLFIQWEVIEITFMLALIAIFRDRKDVFWEVFPREMQDRAALGEIGWRNNVLRHSILSHFNQESLLNDFIGEEQELSSFLELNFDNMALKLHDEKLLNSIPTEDLANEDAVFVLANPETFRFEDRTLDETYEHYKSFNFSRDEIKDYWGGFSIAVIDNFKKV